MSTDNYRVAMIGVGRPRSTEGATGFGMAHRHMAGYRETGRCRLVAVADINRLNAEAFVAEHDADAAIFDDFRVMMREARPDIVSVCLWPHLHSEVVTAIAPLGPRAIHCEKPMDIHWDASIAMHEACREHGVQLTINHQRRFNLPLLKAKELIDGGEIGRVLRIDGAWHNMYDAGTHVMDMYFYFNGDAPANWVTGQTDARAGRTAFGAYQAGNGIVDAGFSNGVRGTYHFGTDWEDLGALVRVSGEAGILEVGSAEPWLRVLRYGSDWEIIDTGENIHDDKAIYRGIADLIDALEQKREPMLSSARALRTTEVLFAAHESARRRERVELPLPPMKSPLLEMLEKGEVSRD